MSCYVFCNVNIGTSSQSFFLDTFTWSEKLIKEAVKIDLEMNGDLYKQMGVVMYDLREFDVEYADEDNVEEVIQENRGKDLYYLVIKA